MINTKQGVWLLGVLGLIIVILLCILFFAPSRPAPWPPQETNGLKILSPTANSKSSSPLKITGQVTGNGWAGFEGQVGTVKLFLEGDPSLELATGILTATTEWTTLPTNFETTLTFRSDIAGLGTLVFHNENPSGLPEKDKTFILPVKIIESTDGTMVVSAYFMNNNLDPEVSCNKVFAVQRELPKTTAVARAALDELLKGPTVAEKNAGFSTSINSGVKIQSLTIENRVAKVDFNEQLEYQAGGSCRVSAIRAQIIETLKQFPTVDSVVISINGRTEDILQP